MARSIGTKDFGEPHQKEREDSHAGNSLTPQGCAGRERGTALHYKSARARTCPSAERPCTTGVRGLELARLVRGIRLAPRECAGRPCTVTKKTGTGGNSETPRNARDPMKAGTATPRPAGCAGWSETCGVGGLVSESHSDDAFSSPTGATVTEARGDYVVEHKRSARCRPRWLAESVVSNCRRGDKQEKPEARAVARCR